MVKIFQLNGQTYHVVQLLGKGTYGKVYQVVSDLEWSDISSDQLELDGKEEELVKYYVIKQIETDSPALISYVKNEIHTLRQLTRMFGSESPFCQLIDYQIRKVETNLVVFDILLEYLEGIDLLQFLINGMLKTADIRPIFRQLILAVDILHTCQIIHRDLKLENILVHKGDNQPRIIILDFGFACNRNPNYLFAEIENPEIIGIAQNCHNRVDLGTLAYMPPEFSKPERRTFEELKKADVWACGVILYALIYRKLPFTPFSKIPFDRQILEVEETIAKKPTIFDRIFADIFVELDKRKSITQLITNHFSLLGIDRPVSQKNFENLPTTSSILPPIRS